MSVAAVLVVVIAIAVIVVLVKHRKHKLILNNGEVAAINKKSRSKVRSENQPVFKQQDGGVLFI